MMPDVFGQFTIDEIIKAHLTYISRSITLKDDSNPEQNIVMIPLADMFNHNNPTDIYIKGEQGTMNCNAKVEQSI